MSVPTQLPAHPSHGPPAWRSWAGGLGLLTLAALATFLPRLERLTLRGEETRRARVAWEMLHSRDFLVPRLQGKVYTSRPPLANWLIAGAAVVRGRFDLVAARAPSLVATLLATWMVYAYSRAFVSAGTAWVAGVVYLSSWKVLELGRLAETEAVLALLTGAALLVWHVGYARRWPLGIVWSLGYALAALAALTKGLQPAVYFGLITLCFLTIRRDWATLRSPWHALGVALFAVIVGGWWAPYLIQQGWHDGLAIWLRNVQLRYEAPSVGKLVEHFATYPLEALFSLLPWSALIVSVWRPEWRRGWGPWSSPLLFLSLAVAVALASCWLATEARPRYLMPVAPCSAALVGLILERVRLSAATSDWRRGWRDFSYGYAAIMATVAFAVLVASACGWFERLPLYQHLPTAIVVTLAACIAAVAIARLGNERSTWAPILGGTLVAASVIVTYDVLWMNWLLRRTEQTAEQVAEVTSKLPPDARLVSFGSLHHAFLFHSQAEIPQLAWPEREISVPDDVEYFCFHETRQPREPLPFAWEKVADISCDRHQRNDPFDRVVVGRRLTPHVARAPERRLR